MENSFKIWVVYHPQLKYLCGNRANSHWSADFQSSRKFNRKSDASNAKVQSQTDFIGESEVIEIPIVANLPTSESKSIFTRELLAKIESALNEHPSLGIVGWMVD